MNSRDSDGRAPGDRGYRPISEYALLSDCHGSALVARDGSIDWCCLQRFDAAPVFGRILDARRGGFFRLAPTGEAEVSRRYLRGTMVLETRFDTASGVLLLTDFMVVTREEEPEAEGPHPRSEDRLIRIARCEAGRVELRVEFVPRFNYGLTVPHLERESEERVRAFGGSDALLLQTPAHLELAPDGARGAATLERGDAARFVVSYRLPHVSEPVTLGAEEIDEQFEATRDFWTTWSERCTYDGEFGAAVRRSALVRKSLSSASGAIVAAPTTSLPERIGGSRNWDYRYSWLRDAGFVVDALYMLGYRAEGEAFIRWLYRTVAAVPEELQIMYGAGGELLLPEFEIHDAEGYCRSAPVRVGNAAARQFQLDIYGDVLHVAWRHHAHGGELSDELWAAMERLVDYVAERWDRPDSGLWEVRSEPRNFVHSRVMAWVAADRGVRLAHVRGDENAARRWSELKKEIRACVLDRGVLPERGAFMRAFELREADAATLLFPLTGFIDPEDPRARATVAWVEEELEHDTDRAPDARPPQATASRQPASRHSLRRVRPLPGDPPPAAAPSQPISRRCGGAGGSYGFPPAPPASPSSPRVLLGFPGPRRWSAGGAARASGRRPGRSGCRVLDPRVPFRRFHLLDRRRS